MAEGHNSLSKGGAFPFPEDNISPKQKELPQFGYEIGKAIWGYAASNESHLFYNDRSKYQKYREYALGMQSEDKYKPLLNEDNKAATDNDWLRAINFQIKNYATKRINIVVSKIHSKNYDVVVEMNDPTTQGLKQNIKNALEIKMRHKKELTEIKNVFGDAVEDLEKIPNNQDELDIMMDNDFKMIEAAHLEQAIPFHLKRNKFEDVRRLMAFDLTVLGVSAAYVGMDENLKPYIERVNVADILTPYNDSPSFSDLPYIARIKWVTVAEFRKMATGYISDTRIQEIIDEFSTKQYDANEYANKYDQRRYDDISKIALLHYNYRSTDTMVHVSKTDKFGNATLFEKEIDYYARPKEMDRFKKKYGDSRELHRTSVNAVYEGFWVIGSDNKQDVFRHGRRAYSVEQYGVFANNGMGFKVYAPNSWDGMMTSMGSQMIPNLDELQRYNLKLQQLVARAIPKGIGIDLYALRKANLKWGNKGMTDQQKIEMFMKSGLFVFSSKDRYAAGSNYKPFYEIENGLANDISKYLLLTQSALAELDEIIGINKAVAASNIREDAGKAVTELQIGASEIALDHLYNADRKIYNEIVEDIGVLHIKSYIYSEKNRDFYDRVFGQFTIGQSNIRFDLFDFNFDIEVRPTDAEWQEIYLSAEKAYDKGIIKYSDTLYLREFTSIKKARLWLMMKEKLAEKMAAEQAQAASEQNGAIQQQSLAAKSQADMALEDKKFQNGVALEEVKRETIMFEANVDINKAEKIAAVTASLDRRENMQEGKIKDRHIDAEGDIDITIEAMKIAGNPEPVDKKKQNDSKAA